MKITDNMEARNEMSFVALSPGDVFELVKEPGFIAMKVTSSNSHETAVILDNGDTCWVSDTTLVRKLDAELVIRR